MISIRMWKERARLVAPARALVLGALAALLSLSSLGLLSCSRGEPIDLTRLRVFYTSDAIGYLEPCG